MLHLFGVNELILAVSILAHIYNEKLLWIKVYKGYCTQVYFWCSG